MKYKIEERVGCIAVVEDSFDKNGLHPNMEGVIAYWRGKYTLHGWKVAEWQQFKAYRLCNMLNGEGDKEIIKKYHLGDPCIYCGLPMEKLEIGDCKGGITVKHNTSWARFFTLTYWRILLGIGKPLNIIETFEIEVDNAKQSS